MSSSTCTFQNVPGDVVKAVYEVSFDPVVRIILQSDDHSEMQVIIACNVVRSVRGYASCACNLELLYICWLLY